MWIKITFKELRAHIVSIKAYDATIRDFLLRHKHLSDFRLELISELEIETPDRCDEHLETLTYISCMGRVSICRDQINSFLSRIHKTRSLAGGCIKIYVGVNQCVVLTEKEYAELLEWMAILKN